MSGNPTMEPRGEDDALSLSPRDRWARLMPVWLALAICFCYAPSLHGGFLNLDDPWLIAENELVSRADLRALLQIWTDLSEETRISLGAEYLPVRDTSVWLEFLLHGATPQIMRVASLLFYLAAVLLLRRGLLCGAVPGGLSFGALEIAIWVFALHPVHVESVAWLAGRKDVLALFFFAVAYWLYAGERTPARRLGVVLSLVLATLSKAMIVIAPGLLLAHDLLARRKPDWWLAGFSALALAGLAVLHLHVGRLVGMEGELLGGSRVATSWVMGGVLLRYLQTLIAPFSLSLPYDAPQPAGATPCAILGFGALAIWGGWALVRELRDQRPLGAVAWAWMFLPLLPVSQAVFPLQNVMADRYLWLSVLSLGLLWGCLAKHVSYGSKVSLVCLVVLGGLTFQRSLLFSDSALLAEDATRKTRTSLTPPYQLGKALEEAGKVAPAIDAYQQTLARSRGKEELARRATNNLSKLYVKQRRLEEAESLLRSGRARWPDDPKVLSNLVKVLSRRGKLREAGALLQELNRRFPDYQTQKARQRAWMRIGD